MKFILVVIILLAFSCCTKFKEKHPQRYTNFCPVPIENYDEEVLKGNAKALNMRYVDYLHNLTNGKIAQLRH